MDTMSDIIKCPECGAEIELSEAFSSQLSEKLRKEFESKQRQRDKKFAARESKLRAERDSLDKAKEAGSLVSSFRETNMVP